MKKLLVAAAVLGLMGVAVAAGVGARRLSCGECPLTGKPMHHAAAVSFESSGSGPATAPSGTAAECTEHAAECSEGAAQQCPMAGKSDDCEKSCDESSMPECCKKKMECDKCQKHAEPAQKP